MGSTLVLGEIVEQAIVMLLHKHLKEKETRVAHEKWGSHTNFIFFFERLIRQKHVDVYQALIEWFYDVFMDKIKKDLHYLKDGGEGIWGDNLAPSLSIFHSVTWVKIVHHIFR